MSGTALDTGDTAVNKHGPFLILIGERQYTTKNRYLNRMWKWTIKYYKKIKQKGIKRMVGT